MWELQIYTHNITWQPKSTRYASPEPAASATPGLRHGHWRGTAAIRRRIRLFHCLALHCRAGWGRGMATLIQWFERIESGTWEYTTGRTRGTRIGARHVVFFCFFKFLGQPVNSTVHGNMRKQLITASASCPNLPNSRRASAARSICARYERSWPKQP